MVMTLPIQKPGAAHLGETFFQDRHRLRMHVERHAEGFRHAVGGDVVMRRPDATGGEDVVVGRAQRIERGNNRGRVVGDDAHFLEIDAERGKIVGGKADILVLGPAGEDFIADDQQRGGDDGRVHGG
jgi:hypothetical protein